MFGSSLDDYLHLLVPPVVKLFDSSDIPLTVRRLVNKEFKEPRRLLQRKGHFKIEFLCRLSVLRFFHVDHVVRNRRSVFSLKSGKRKIFCCEHALSLELKMWNFHVVVWQTTSKNFMQLLACRTCSTIIFPHLTNHIIGVWLYRCRLYCRLGFLNTLRLVTQFTATYVTSHKKPIILRKRIGYGLVVQ